MWMILAVLLVGALSGCGTVDLPKGVHPELVVKVASGEVSEARVAWWGYDPEDATRFVQAALDSGARTLILDAEAGPWNVLPLRGHSDQTLVFEGGAELVAKRGAYQALGATLLGFIGCTNVTLRGNGGLRMWRDDYLDKGKYRHSEWRMGLSLMSCAHVTVEGLRFAETGGDGIYMGALSPDRPCEDVVVRRCRFERNNRQGISVIAARNLLIEDSAFEDTKGAPPQDGIDFEPNNPREVLENCTVRNCTFARNAGRAIEVVLLQYDSKSKPVSIRIEGCTATGDVLGGFSYLGAQKDILDPVNDGSVKVFGSVFRESDGPAVNICKKPFSSGRIVFRDCCFDRCCAKKPANPDVDIQVFGHEVYKPDVVGFKNVKIVRRADGDWLSQPLENTYRGTPTIITGEVQVVRSDGSREVQKLDHAWWSRRYPSIPGSAIEKLPVCPLDSNARIVDLAPGRLVPMSSLAVRGRNRYAFHAAKAGRVNMMGHQDSVGSRTVTDGDIRIMRYGDAKILTTLPFPKSTASEAFGFDVPEPGFYTMEFSTTGGNGFAIDAADVPLAFDVTRSMVWLIYAKGDLYVPLRTGARFAFFGLGSGTENFAAEVFDPSGASVDRRDCCFGAFHYTTPVGAPTGLWRLHVDRPKRGVSEDAQFQVTGIPGFLFLSHEKYWE